MSKIILKFKAGLPKDHPNTLIKLQTLINSISTRVQDTALIHKIEAMCKFKCVLSINEDIDSYVFDAYSERGYSVLSIPKYSPAPNISQSDWQKSIDLMFQHCMGITPNVTNILMDDLNNQLLAIERSTKDTSDLFCKYDKVIANLKVMLLPSARINAQRPKEILEDITATVRGRAFDTIRQKIFDKTLNHVSSRGM